MLKIRNRKIKIFGDGIKIANLKKINNKLIDGITYNPTLFRKLRINNYLNGCKKIIKFFPNKPISLEVISDNSNSMIEQALKIQSLADNVYVKIPITFTNGKSVKAVLRNLVNEGVNINLTAVFTITQIKNIINIIEDTDTIISVFAGRLFDIGINAEEEMKKINSFIHKNSNCKSLWASPRSSYDVYRAINSNTDIITISEDLINKFKLFDKKPEKYSLETVNMFYNDAKKSKFKI